MRGKIQIAIVVAFVLVLGLLFASKCNQIVELTKENDKLMTQTTRLLNDNEKLRQREGIKYVAGKKVSWEELDLLARLIRAEAGNKSLETRMLVGSVVLNRMGSSLFPNDMESVIYQDSQFSVTFLKYDDGTVMIDRPADMMSFRAAYDLLMEGSITPMGVLYFWDDSIEPIREVSAHYKKSENMIFSY